MRTLLIDDDDSYTLNLFHLLGGVNDGDEAGARRRGDVGRRPPRGPDNVVISPGPGRPEHSRDAGVALELLRGPMSSCSACASVASVFAGIPQGFRRRGAFPRRVDDGRAEAAHARG